MSNYKGLFTYDINNHRYIPVEQADGIISDMNYDPEPKEYWFINSLGNVKKAPSDWLCDDKESRKEIGNYFETKEEAEKAVERLRAWKRLKDKGFGFTSFAHIGADGWVHGEAKFILPQDRLDDEAEKDLDLLFGGEE